MKSSIDAFFVAILILAALAVALFAQIRIDDLGKRVEIIEKTLKGAK